MLSMERNSSYFVLEQRKDHVDLQTVKNQTTIVEITHEQPAKMLHGLRHVMQEGDWTFVPLLGLRHSLQNLLAARWPISDG
jgi:hypothetical protein